MRASERVNARRQLDLRLGSMGAPQSFTRPPKGWLRAIREALGMTAAQLGKRLGVSQSRVVEMEKAEARSAITLASLERAAEALNCQLVYTLIPREPLERTIERRALEHAQRQIAATRHSMALEAQKLTPADDRVQLERLARTLAETGGSSLWEDEP